MPRGRYRHRSRYLLTLAFLAACAFAALPRGPASTWRSAQSIATLRPAIGVDLAAPSGGPGDPILYQALKLLEK